MRPARRETNSLNRCTHFVMVIVAAFGALAFSACAGTKMLETKTIQLRCDSNFNDGLILPLDLIYIPEGSSVDEVTGVSPEEWFESETRENWSHKQSMSIKATEARKTIDVNLRKPKKTIALVIVADYRGIESAKSQLIVLDAEAKENEDVFITTNGLLH